MDIDRAKFATKCVREGLNCGINPHYLLGVAQLRSGISEGSQNGEIGPFRLTTTQWDANRTDEEFAFDFQSQDINEWDLQCAVFALMAHRAFDAFALANNRDPSARELYLQQWSAAPAETLSADLQTALDATAALVDPAAASVPDASPSMPPKIGNPAQPAQRAAMGPKLRKLVAANLQRWRSMQVHANLIPILDGVAHKLIAPVAKARYQAISATTQVPWFIIAVIHQREASRRFAANLAQGDPWNQKSTHVPKGRGPFASFEAAAIDALTKCPPFAARWQDWTIGGALTLLEQYNGLGYANRGLPSPYIWASTDQYVKGKFISDHGFDPNFVDPQSGCAALLTRMKFADATIVI